MQEKYYLAATLHSVLMASFPCSSITDMHAWQAQWIESTIVNTLIEFCFHWYISEFFCQAKGYVLLNIYNE